MGLEKWVTIECEDFAEATHYCGDKSDTQEVLEHLRDQRYYANEAHAAIRVLDRARVDSADWSVGYTPSLDERVYQLVCELETLRKYFNIVEGLKRKSAIEALPDSV